MVIRSALLVILGTASIRVEEGFSAALRVEDTFLSATIHT
jgi:hypothetical protein